MTGGPTSDPRHRGIYRFIRWVFGADLVIGLLLAVAGYWIWNRAEIWIFGLGLAAVGLLMLWLFPLLLRRAEERDPGPDTNRN